MPSAVTVRPDVERAACDDHACGRQREVLHLDLRASEPGRPVRRHRAPGPARHEREHRRGPGSRYAAPQRPRAASRGRHSVVTTEARHARSRTVRLLDRARLKRCVRASRRRLWPRRDVIGAARCRCEAPPSLRIRAPWTRSTTPEGVEERWQRTWEEEGLYRPAPDAAGTRRSRSRCRRRTSPAICTWATRSTARSRTCSSAGTACGASTRSGSRATTTRASRRRT